MNKILRNVIILIVGILMMLGVGVGINNLASRSYTPKAGYVTRFHNDYKNSEPVKLIYGAKKSISHYYTHNLASVKDDHSGMFNHPSLLVIIGFVGLFQTILIILHLSIIFTSMIKSD